VLTKLAFADQNTKQTVKHITVRMEISDIASDRRLLSEFLHAHNGNIDIDFKPTAGLKYVHIA
jgi:predicted transport protein